MATSTEIQSLNDIQYKIKIKLLLLLILTVIIFSFTFLSFYPIGEKFKAQLKSHLSGTTCNPDFSEIRMEWFLPKIIISDLTLPASCLNKSGNPVKFNFVTINWNIINFSPMGLPFHLETEINGQPLEIYYVLGINEQLVRLKDQTLVLSRLESLMNENFKLQGSVTVDMSLLLSSNLIKNLELKSVSKDLQIPSQNIQGFTLPPLKVNDFYLEANSTNHPRISIDKLIVGDPESPMRANFKGHIDIQEGNMAFSPIDLSGEIAFSENFKQTIPLVDMLFQSFTQKDGFYQVRLGGTLGAPKPSAP